MRGALVIPALAAGVLLAACSTAAGSHPAAKTHPVAVASPSASTSSPSPSPTPSGPTPCNHQLNAWLANRGTQMLDAIHQDLSNYNRDDGAVVGDLMNGGNTASDINTWITDLEAFENDAATLQANPAPAGVSSPWQPQTGSQPRPLTYQPHRRCPTRQT
jgi:hypothetical protein